LSRFDLIKQVAAALKSCQCRFLLTAGVSYGARPTGFTDQITQPISEFLVVGRCIDRNPDLTEKCSVVNSLMRFTVTGNQARTIHCKQHIQLHKIDIMNDLVIGALEEGRVDSHYRKQPLASQPRRKTDGVFLCHTHIEESILMRMLEEIKAGSVFHGSRYGAKARFLIPQLCQHRTKHRGERVDRKSTRLNSSHVSISYA